MILVYEQNGSKTNDTSVRHSSDVDLVTVSACSCQSQFMAFTSVPKDNCRLKFKACHLACKLHAKLSVGVQENVQMEYQTCAKSHIFRNGGPVIHVKQYL